MHLSLSLLLMERALTTALALSLFTLVGLTCVLSANDVVSVHLPHLPQGLAHQHSYVPTFMSVRHIRLSAGYCCNLVCFCAEINNATVEPCAAMQDRFATLSPSLCDSASLNSSSMLYCPPPRAATLCNGGASCCTDSCNNSCTSQLDVCACPCNNCATCSCCKRVENRLCRLRCRPCDKVSMMLDFQDKLGKPHSANFTRDFSHNSTEAQNFYYAHKGNSSIVALYEPNDPTIVYVSPRISFVKLGNHDDIFLGGLEEYPVWGYWANYGVMAAFPIFTVSVILTGLLIALLLQRLRRADRRPFRIAWSVNRGLWMGIIWPLIIMLLILQVRYPVPHADSAHSILFPQLLVCIGWLPLVLLWLYHTILSSSFT